MALLLGTINGSTVNSQRPFVLYIEYGCILPIRNKECAVQDSLKVIAFWKKIDSQRDLSGQIHRVDFLLLTAPLMGCLDWMYGGESMQKTILEYRYKNKKGTARSVERFIASAGGPYMLVPVCWR